MTDHEKLKEICDKIEHESHFKYNEPLNGYSGEFYYKYTGGREVNVRQIIFTQEFMDKFLVYMMTNRNELKVEHWVMDIMTNLNKPTDYLYNLIK